MELKLGKMTSKELAAWFGISYGSFRNKKTEKLKELTFYCSYELVYGGITISNIFIKEYLKPTPAYAFIKANFLKHWHKSMLDTCARVGSEMYYTYKDTELKGLKESTIKAYVAKARLEMFGHVYQNDYGTDRYCHPEPVVDNHWEEAEQLSEEQMKLYKQCLQEAYYSEEDAMIEEAYCLHLISDTEYEEIKKDREKNSKVIREARHAKMMALCDEKIGFYPNQITKIEKGIFFKK